MAEEHEVQWREYWDFLGGFADFRTPEGLLILERYLARRARQSSGDDFYDVNGNALGSRSSNDILNGNHVIAESDAAIGGERDVDKIARAANDIASKNVTRASTNDVIIGSNNASGDVTHASNDVIHASSDDSEGETADAPSPGDMSLLAAEFAKLKLDSSLDDGGATHHPRSDRSSCSDSESDGEFLSAPSSPLKLAANADNVASNAEQTRASKAASARRRSDDSDEDVFLDAQDVRYPHPQQLLARTPQRRVVLPSREDGGVFLDG